MAKNKKGKITKNKEGKMAEEKNETNEKDERRKSMDERRKALDGRRKIDKLIFDNEKILEKKIIALEKTVDKLNSARRGFPFLGITIIVLFLGIVGYFFVEKRMASSVFDYVLQEEFLVNKSQQRREIDEKINELKNDAMRTVNSKFNGLSQEFKSEKQRAILEVKKKSEKLQKEFLSEIKKVKTDSIRVLEVQHRRRIDELHKKFYKKLDEFKSLFKNKK